MSNNLQRHPQPQLGATFYPGGTDDFYLPEVISPAPQRVRPEIPEHIQDNLANISLKEDALNRMSGLQSPLAMDRIGSSEGLASYPSRNSSLSQLDVSGDQYQTSGPNSFESRGGPPSGFGQRAQQQSSYNADQPSFSPFPPIRDRPANVPPSDDEKETILENARIPVLHSNDPEMQLTWAQDTLTYVEMCQEDMLRNSEDRGPRPPTPQLEHQLRISAVDVVSYLADQHHPKAEFLRGMWLEFGKFGFRMDKKEAYRCYSRSAQGGNARAEYRMGMQFENSNDVSKAIDHYEKGAEAGDSASSYRLGMMALLGQHGQRQDFARGLELIKFSAENADENAPQGAYIYGMLQARDLPQINIPEELLPLNLNSARYNIEKAAYLGFAKAQTKMGAAYELCQLGCDFDPALSLHYNHLASKQGEPEADMAVSKWFLCGHEGLFSKNEELAFTYAQRAAQIGLPTAEFAMGYFYEVGISVPANIQEARKWYNKAAEHGNKDAIGRIDGISRSKTLSKKDHEDVAIKRIKSQHASQRGRRPERFRPTAAPLTEEVVDIPDTYQQPPLRETRPYSRQQQPARPGSAAPYPSDSDQRPRPQHASSSAYYNPEVRPSSAFGINPNIRPTSTASIAVQPSRAQSGSPMVPNLAPRPHSSISDMGAGRGGAGLPLRPGPGSSGPQGYRQPGGGLPPSPLAGKLPNEAMESQPPRLDIGYTAPLDPSGADRRKRLQRPESSNPVPMRPPTSQGYGAPAGRTSASTPKPGTPTLGLPQSQNVGSGYRSASPSRQSGRPDSANRAQRQTSMPIAAANKPMPAPPTSMMSPSPPSFDGRPPSTGPPTPSTTAAKPPGKGPKTFAEMGIPQEKKETDCVLM